jgi:hypothetical protein
MQMLIVTMSGYGKRGKRSGATGRRRSVTPYAHTRDKKKHQEKVSCKDKTGL